MVDFFRGVSTHFIEFADCTLYQLIDESVAGVRSQYIYLIIGFNLYPML